MPPTFDPKKWKKILDIAFNEGWEYDEDLGDLLDDDADYDSDTNERREAYRKSISRMQAINLKKSDSPSLCPGDFVQDETRVLPGCETIRPSSLKQAIQTHEEEPTELDRHNYVYVDRHNEGIFTQAWCEGALNAAVKRWCPEETDESHYGLPWMVALRQFRLLEAWDGQSMPIRGLTQKMLLTRYRAEAGAIFELITRSNQAHLWEVFRSDCNRVVESIHHAFQMLWYMLEFQSVWSPNYTPHDEPCVYAFSTRRSPGEEISPFQEIIVFLSRRIHEYNYVRYRNELLYKRIINEDGYFVHCYDMACTIEEFIYRNINQYDNFNIWTKFVKEGNVRKSVVDYLAKCYDPQIPVLKKDRYVHAFRNGLYFVKDDYFHKFTDGKISSKIVACKYHPLPFDLHDDMRTVDFLGADDGEGPRIGGTAYDIPTPMFEKIMLDQGWGYQLRLWCYIMLGRMLYWAKDHDNWQVWPFFYGLARTGKSTMCQIFSDYFYDRNDIGELANNIERRFGIWALCNMFGVTGPEIAKDFNIDRTDLQKMICGEELQVAAKNAKAEKVQWNAPGMLAGNHIPAWDDPQGAMPRRLLIFLFRNQITADGQLLNKLQFEIPNLIVKANRMYQAAVKALGNKSPWDSPLLPQVFRDNRAMMQAEVSPFHGFLMSDIVTICKTKDGVDDSVYMPLGALATKFREWKQANNIRGEGRFNSELYEKAFKDLKIPMPKKCRLPYPRDSGQTTQAKFVYGIDLTEEIDRLAPPMETE